MFHAECGGCGAGLRPRDEKCRQCNRPATRAATGGTAWNFASTVPATAVAAVAAPDDGADLALAVPTTSGRRKGAKAEKAPRVPRTRRGAEAALMVTEEPAPVAEEVAGPEAALLETAPVTDAEALPAAAVDPRTDEAESPILESETSLTNTEPVLA